MNNSPDHIRTILKQGPISQSDIARMLKVTPAAISRVISGQRDTWRIRQAIALAIGKTIGEIWPDE